jgi:hypothetical protein
MRALSGEKEMEKANMAETTQSLRVEGKDVTLEVYADGSGPAIVVLPSYGRGAAEDFDSFAHTVSAAGFKVLAPSTAWHLWFKRKDGRPFAA